MNIQRILSITASAILFYAQIDTASAQDAPVPTIGDSNTAPSGTPAESGATGQSQTEGGILPFGSNPYNSFSNGQMGAPFGNPGMMPGGQMPIPRAPFMPPVPGQISQFPNPGMLPGGQLPIPRSPISPPIPGQMSQFPYPNPNPFPNPNPNPYYGCTPVSVKGDATYCVQGPVCSGSGYAPAGVMCPQAGDFAVGDCKPGLPSSGLPNMGLGLSCRLPMHTLCVQVNWDTWGCAMENDWGLQNGGYHGGQSFYPPPGLGPSKWGASPIAQRQWPAPPLPVAPVVQRQWGK
ncbi:unnamed protein product [Albugo candida]|uniref:CBM1 domain-containing protein n=1 Tax=Albugo candida TaxID=65357 RepID=A0A024G5K1_9STRA|nr:unnamed protein product [Albugo candida]|eukprot:CCI41828.1 unnamed protein product [Albugo candida]